jgi:hypothetical protein
MKETSPLKAILNKYSAEGKNKNFRANAAFFFIYKSELIKLETKKE